MVRILSIISALLLLLLTARVADAQASPHAQGFLTHAAFFSLEAKQANVIDPQVFVADAEALAATGPQGIMHIAGVRPAFGVDDPEARALNAQGKPLGFTLRQWFGARGRITLLAAASGGTAMAYTLTGLVPGGTYSFFENHFSSDVVTFTPLDGSAQRNTFMATSRGTANGTLTIPGAVTHSEAILLVYHSDGTAHGMDRGQIGVNAHHQLIERLP
jgi:hypothetical protein